MARPSPDRPGRAPHVLVVGGGVVGLLTALEAVLAGAVATVVEQGDLPNVLGTSHDHHRIVRALHAGDPAATATATKARDLWLAIERLLGVSICHRTGALVVAPEDGAVAAARLLRTAGARATVVDDDAVAARFPHLRAAPGAAAVLEEDAVVVLADRALGALVRRLAALRGVRLLGRRRVVEIDPAAAAARLADGRVVHGDVLVVAAGPWSKAVLSPGLAGRLVLHRQTVVYCHPPAGVAAAWAASPAVLGLGRDGGTWLVPPVAGTPLKVSAAAVARQVDEPDDDASPAEWVALVVDRCAEAIPAFDPGWVVAARDCHYLAEGTTGGPLLATLAPGTAWAFAACGGTSFKFAPVIARALVAAALNGQAGAGPADPFRPVATIATTTTTGVPS
jgi:sarcosine oxidase